jgi:hypothetical protein
VGLLICNKMHVGNVREGVVRKLGMAWSSFAQNKFLTQNLLHEDLPSYTMNKILKILMTDWW